jgi:hypothetical protein
MSAITSPHEFLSAAAEVSPELGAATIGYANKPGKADDLTAAEADAVVARIDELTEAIRAT